MQLHLRHLISDRCVLDAAVTRLDDIGRNGDDNAQNDLYQPI
jgi:hypothetical protein